MRRPAVLTAAIAVATVIALVVVALADRRSEAFTLGVPGNGITALRPGADACQRPIAVPEHADFDAVRLMLGTNHHPGAPLDVVVRDARGGAVLARGRLAGGYPDVDRAPSHVVHVGEVAAGRVISVCLVNRGQRRMFVYGAAGAASRTSELFIDGKAQPSDMDLVFLRRSPRSLAALAPAVAERAALFRAGWVGAWTYVVLGLLVLVVVPVLLVRAVGSAASSSTSESRSPSAGQP
jgi:hypothetical protein